MEGCPNALSVWLRNGEAIAHKQLVSMARLGGNMGPCLWLLITFLWLSPARAQTENVLPAPSIEHTVPDSASLPPPGSKVKLSAFLVDSNQFERPMRLVVSRDDRTLDVWLPAGKLDDRERALYEFNLYAPEYRFRYRFIWYSPEGVAISSPQFTLERSCRFPSKQVAPDEATLKGDALSEAEETARLFHVSEALNREISAYQEATKLLGELRGKINALQKARTESENGG